MSDTMKHNCTNCRALYLMARDHLCKLNYKVNTRKLLFDFLEVYPLEPCPKPLTFYAYFQITQARYNLARVKKFNIDLKSIS